MSTDKLLNDAEVSELKQKSDFINVFTLMSMWAQVILAFGLFILFPNPLTFFISAIIIAAKQQNQNQPRAAEKSNVTSPECVSFY